MTNVTKDIMRSVIGHVPKCAADRESISLRELAMDDRMTPWHTAILIADHIANAGASPLPIVDTALREWLPLALDKHDDLHEIAAGLRALPAVTDEATAHAARTAVLVARQSIQSGSPLRWACDDASDAAKLETGAADYAADVLNYLPDSPAIRDSLLRFCITPDDIRHWFHANGTMHPLGTYERAIAGDAEALRIVARDLDGGK